MQTCDTCGNGNEPLFSLTKGTRTGNYDSFECAIHDMAERCAHCQCAIMGHAVRREQLAYCCQHCAECD